MGAVRNSAGGLLVLAALALTPKAALAEDGVTSEGTFTVTHVHPTSAISCAVGGTPIEAQGIGSMSGLGPLFFKLAKCLSFPSNSSVGTFAGTFVMTAGNGDNLNGTYAGTQDFSQRDAAGFGPFQGTLTFTGGTGSFHHASGVASFSAIGKPIATDAQGVNVGMAYYLVQATH